MKKNVTKTSLLYWAFNGNVKLQVCLLCIVVLIVFARVLPLEMQKRIINEAIALQNKEKLFLYSGIYLASITASGLLKLGINYIQSIIGERAMLAMRKELYSHILTLPLHFFRKTQPGMVVSALMTELSAAGSFAGMAFAAPLTNILTLLAFAIYLMWLNTSLALLTLTIYPAVVFILPLLQKRANRANKKRVDIARTVSSQIAESVSGISEIQVQAAYQQEDRKFLSYIKNLKRVRIRWALLKFGIKTTNNYFVSLGPFLVLLYGGYLIMHGELQLGSMVAFLSSQEKLYDPWKELIDFYQVYQDASIRYKRTMEYFDEQPEFLLEAPPLKPVAKDSEIVVKNLCFHTEEGKKLLKNISFTMEKHQHIAFVGFSGSGKSTLVQCLAKMYKYQSGSVQIDGEELHNISKNSLAQHMGYISQLPFIFTGSIKDNLLYAQQATDEVAGRPECSAGEENALWALQQAGFFADVIKFGLETVIDPQQNRIIEAVLAIRKKFRNNRGRQLNNYIEFYRNDRFMNYCSLLENIVFGRCGQNGKDISALLDESSFLDFLQQQGATASLEKLGRKLCIETLSLTHGLSDPQIVLSHTPLCEEELDKARSLLKNDQEHSFFIQTALRLIPAQHTMVIVDSEEQNLLLQLRREFKNWAKATQPKRFSFYEKSSYINNESLLTNIFMGRAKSSTAHAQDKLYKALIQLLIEEDVLEDVARLGMQFQVGNTGDRLSGGQKQKLAIARILLKDPPLYIMDEATSALDNNSQSRIQKLIDKQWQKKGVIAVMHRLDQIDSFDKIGVMKAGQLLEFGSYQELIDKKGLFYQLKFGRQ